MTTQKTIGQLTELTAANTSDVVPIVDNSGQSGVTKRITIENAFKSVPAGQAATPGLAFSGDVDTGISRVGADQLALCTGGQARLTVGATGDITIGSNLIVDGTTTTISSETLLVEDKNIELGTVASPSDTTADGGGITLKGATDKTIKWIDSTNAWTFNNMISVQTSVSSSVYAELKTAGDAMGLRVDLTAGSSASDSVALHFKTSDSGSETTKMRIASNGVVENGVGILANGTHGAGEKFTGGGFVGINNLTYTTSAICFRVRTGNPTMTDRMYIRNDGDLENSNNSYTGISDIKLKENIVDAASQWEDIKTLQVRKFNFKESTGLGTHTQIGLVAQEVEAVSPGLVKERSDLDNDDQEIGTVTKSVNYSVLYMKAVKALQEAMERIETLEQRLSDAGIA